MSKIVLLDAGPLGMISHPRNHPEIKFWLENLLRSGIGVRVSEVADYEVRRELLRLNKQKGIQRLDNLINRLGYTPITREVMLQAAQFWADARKQGQPTANNQALDADVILAAQAFTIGSQGENTVIATTNVRHLTRFVPAQLWNEIT
ncbi:MAG TPA: nuclease [Kamptonema sp.]|nr:nuclease [Kamptonema sp.]